jgi:hypothetical protein
MDQALTVIDNSTALTVTDNTTPTVSTDNVILFHANGIKTAWNKQVSGIVETGELLLKAKKDLSGRWLKLFDPKVGNLPFCEDTAQLLMKIARHPVLSNAEHVRYLPPHWSTLAILSRATPKQLEKWIMDGSVNIDTDRKDAESLVKPAKAKAAKKAGASARAGRDEGTTARHEHADDKTVSDATAGNGANEVEQAIQALYALACDATADWTKADPDMVHGLIEEMRSRLDANK